MENYKVTIIESSRELTAKERVAIKTFANAQPLDVPEMNGAIIEPKDWAVVSVHNEKSDNVDYEKYLIIGNDGNRYVTGSKPFWTSFRGIWDEMVGTEESWGFVVRHVQSKNHRDKEFIICEII